MQSLQNRMQDPPLNEVMNAAGGLLSRAAGRFTSIGVQAGTHYLLMRRLAHTAIRL
jgi:hypothetical protein